MPSAGPVNKLRAAADLTLNGNIEFEPHRQPMKAKLDRCESYLWVTLGQVTETSAFICLRDRKLMQCFYINAVVVCLCQ